MSDPDKSSASDSAELERDAERAAVLKKAELLEWAYERQAARRQAEHEASKPKPEPAPVRRSHQGAEMTGAWENYIADRIKHSEQQTMRAMSKAIAETVVKDVIALEKRCAALEAELAEMRDRETTRRLRAVPSSPPSALIA